MSQHAAVLAAICEELEVLGEVTETTAITVDELKRLSAQVLRAVNQLETKVGKALDELAEVPGMRRQIVMLEQRVRAG